MGAKKNGGYVLVDMRNIAVGDPIEHRYQGTTTYDAITKAIENQKPICLYNLVVKTSSEDDAPILPISPVLTTFLVDPSVNTATSSFLDYTLIVAADYIANQEFVTIRM